MPASSFLPASPGVLDNRAAVVMPWRANLGLGRLGQYLLALGVVLCGVLAWKLMWGHIRVERLEH